ncbi:hypothetical protein FVEG_15427 [Fusarium verticillioides 7600]|uniref:Uncharacterized protein n=1 Tax=Gibberella moniliformis (strain M3125 / FGSC 7600) TaxID=334819 RepID=W7M4E3_GIBM7|nr:hypothetical protein FVEG_15427 [Fusarium verticillioides 7600]EWG42389.1 hypothetical protein FVEG_15427 [Fusarium verticillioides 7600]
MGGASPGDSYHLVKPPHESTLARGPRVHDSNGCVAASRFASWASFSFSFPFSSWSYVLLLLTVFTTPLHPPVLDPPSLIPFSFAGGCFFPFFSNCPSHHQLRPSRPSRCRTMPPPMADFRRASRTVTADNVFLFWKRGWIEILVSPCQGPISSDVPNSRVSIRKSHN